MQLDTIRFGLVDIDESKILAFDEGVPGLEEYQRFSLLQYDDSYPIIWLQSVDDGGICLPALDIFAILPDYEFTIDDEDVKLLELNGPEDFHVICVMVIPDEIERMTVNLAAPVIINTRLGKAKQIILGGSDYNVRAPIFQNLCRILREEGASDAGTVEKAE